MRSVLQLNVYTSSTAVDPIDPIAGNYIVINYIVNLYFKPETTLFVNTILSVHFWLCKSLAYPVHFDVDAR